MTHKSLLETVADWCEENNTDATKVFVDEWRDVNAHPIPEYTWCIVDSDEGILVAYHTTNNDWDDGRIANVYYWMPLVRSPSYPNLK